MATGQTTETQRREKSTGHVPKGKPGVLQEVELGRVRQHWGTLTLHFQE